MKINQQTPKVLILIGAVILVVIAAVWFMLDRTDHIEDTNGADNHSLQTITDENITKMDTGSIGGPKIQRDMLSGDAVTFSAKKFTGVYEVLYDNFVLPSDFDLDLFNYEITGGNFKLVVVHDDKVVATLEPGTFVDYRLEDVTGTVSLRLAGESASFRFSMAEIDYDLHSHANEP